MPVPTPLLARAAPLLAALLAAACTSPQPCPSPLEECDGQCIDLQSDRRHCGGCGRACPAGVACAAATCGSGPSAACTVRTGGAFVTVGACGASVKLWIEDDGFVSAAEAGLGGASAGVPVLAVQAGADCDAQWSWRADPAPASFAAVPPEAACQACPGQIQGDVPGYVASVGRWCPAGATVLSVVRR